ncbi:metallophosphatase [Halobellus salinus]|uniref:DNA double-strand break repair protein Mre11 n=1 Tax=Halobellus salinus TaxID=931585 RepID=A0A830EJ28_9EURY|nr:DNA double-strand break repair protein Mre11 [Halobellus salinus]GGJ15212.1 metallophosphatase [Halobellus salinus]SMP32807.1 DNA repair exonuclease SbcCD nuclease subunit [Halobellus salinus]
MTRVIHTGDTHLGYAQYHSQIRRADFRDAFEQVIDDAVDDDVDAVVHAGDLFHDRRPELSDLMETIRLLRRLRGAAIPFLAVVGNHESTRSGQWLDLFADLGLAERLGSEPRTVGETAFYGLDHVPKSRRSELEYDFAPHDADHAVLVAHGLFTPFAHADWETETVLAESAVDFDAVLLGDNHEPGTETVDGTWVTYCGSTERASAAEETARGYNLVTVDDGVDIRRRTLDTRRFVFASVSLSAGEGAERVHEQLRQRDVTDAVAVVEITGDGESVAPAAIEESLTERGALVARVTDRRDREVDADLDVSFADPDDAVEERIRDLGLSAAALDVDGTIRGGEAPDSNVRAAVESRVAEQLDGDRSAFRTAAGGDTPAESGGDRPNSGGTGGSADAGGSETDGPAADDEDDRAAPTEPDTETDTQVTLEDL